MGRERGVAREGEAVGGAAEEAARHGGGAEECGVGVRVRHRDEGVRRSACSRELDAAKDDVVRLEIDLSDAHSQPGEAEGRVRHVCV